MKKISSLSDEELVSLVRSKNQELYKEIVIRYQNKLIRYANGIINERSLSEDVVQEAFIKAYINLKSFNIKKKFSSWIYRIVHNEAINAIKKTKREISLDENEWLKNSMKDKTDVEEEYSKKELSKFLRNNINKLPVKYKPPLVLYFFEEKSYEEISDVLRIPTGTVGTRINRGKKLLSAIIKGGENYEEQK